MNPVKKWKQKQTMQKQLQMEMLQGRTALRLFRVNKEMQGMPCDLYLGYLVDDITLYQELMPLVCDVMKEILKPCVVWTHLFSLTKLKDGKPTQEEKEFFNFFAKPYRDRVFYDTQSANTLFLDSASLLSMTSGADLRLLNTLWDSKFSAVFENYSYGFCESSQQAVTDFRSAIKLLEQEKYDVLLSYQPFHPGLRIQLNSDKICGADVIEQIISACNKYGKELLLELDAG